MRICCILMVQKRKISHGGDGNSEFPAREAKRQLPFMKFLTDLGSGPSLQELALKLEPSFRSWVREEVERAMQSNLRPSLKQIETTQSRAFQLHFDDKLPSTLFTGNKIESEDSRPVRVFLREASSNRRITSGPLSSIRVSLAVLDGAFNPNDREHWTEEEFNRKVVREREGKRPLLTGDLMIQLKDGVGYVGDASFTDNSSWIKSRNFRLGLKLINYSGDLRIREGVSMPFIVKDHRGESYRKHYPPSLDDEIWRLEKIAKDGASHKRLSQKGVSSVKHFLRLYVTSPSLLRDMLACGMSSNTWEKITDHAKTCVLDNSELYVYKAAESVILVFNCIYELVGAILDGQTYQSMEKLDMFQKGMVEDFKRNAYKNLNAFVPLEEHSAIGHAVLVSNLQIGLSKSPVYQLEMNFPVEQDQLELLSSTNYPKISPPLSYRVQQDSPIAVSMPGSSHGTQAFDSKLKTSFFIGDSCCEFSPSEYDWPPSGSVESLGIYDFGTPLWQGNELLVSSSIQPVSPNFGFYNTRYGKPKARWCKIRAVLKWRILVKGNVAARI